MENLLEDVLEQLVVIRKEEKISIMTLAKRMHTSHSHAWRMDKGKTTPLYTTVARYAQALGYKLTLHLEKEVE